MGLVRIGQGIQNTLLLNIATFALFLQRELVSGEEGDGKVNESLDYENICH